MPTELIDPPETQLATIEAREKPRVSAIEVAARQLAVVDKASADEMGIIASKASAALKEVDAECKPICQKMHEAHKLAVAHWNRMRALYEGAKEIADGKVRAWQAAEREKAEAEARRLAAIETARLEAERAERMRIAEEERQRAEAARQAAIAAAKASKDAEALAAAKAAPPPPPVYVEPPVQAVYVAPAKVEAVKGVRAKPDVWRAEVVNVAELPREYMVPNQQALDGLARSTKGSIQIAGVRFYKE